MDSNNSIDNTKDNVKYMLKPRSMFVLPSLKSPRLRVVYVDPIVPLVFYTSGCKDWANRNNPLSFTLLTGNLSWVIISSVLIR